MTLQDYRMSINSLRYWEGRESYQKKLDFIVETYNDLVAKDYTFDDFMNCLRSKSGKTIQRI